MLNKTFSYGRQFIDHSDVKAVVEVLNSDWLTQGPKIQEFEKILCSKFGAKYCSVVSNGTAGLHLIALALNWSRGDIVITSPITFLASANCILYAGATPDFVDIDQVTYTLDINKLEDKIKKYRSKGLKIKSVIGVDYAGHPCDWNGLRYLANKYEFQLVNDNCHAMGAVYQDDFQYAVKYADIINLSFHPVKHITTGEGGAVLTNNEHIDNKIKMLRTHGTTNKEEHLIDNHGPWYYEMHYLGYNYRITDFQCALGISQINKLEGYLLKRREIAKFYNKYFRDLEYYCVPYVSKEVKHAYHLYPLLIDFDKLIISKADYFEKLKGKNINLQVHYIPIHLQPYYKHKFEFKKGDYPISEDFYSKEISIPIYPGLKKDDLEYIADTIKKYAV